MIDKQDDQVDQVDSIRHPTKKEARRREAFNNLNSVRTRDIARTRDNKDTDVVKLNNLTINLTSTRDITRTRGKEDSHVGNIQQVIPQGQGAASIINITKYNYYYLITTISNVPQSLTCHPPQHILPAPPSAPLAVVSSLSSSL